MSVRISSIQFEHHREPLGIGESSPRLSWRFEGDARDWIQKAYEVEIEQGEGGKPVVYRVESTGSSLVSWPGVPLKSASAATVRVRAYGSDNRVNTEWSEYHVVETGLLDRKDWTGLVVTPKARSDPNLPKQPVLFRRTFESSKAVKKARIYIAGLGIYEAFLNGKRIGDHVLSPSWTTYSNRHVYQTFDVTQLIKTGGNVLAAEVGEGWYSGRLGFGWGIRNVYGDRIGLLAKLVITYESGKTQVIDTDKEWKSSTGAVVTSEIYDGEYSDLRRHQKGWNTTSFKDSSWKSIELIPIPQTNLVSPDGPPIRRTQEVKPVSLIKTPSGKKVIDFGQNLVGWLRINLPAAKGVTISLQHVEVLDHGEIATRPLRAAKATDSITLSDEPHVWEPKCTFHGFRYVQVNNFPVEIDLSRFTAIVVHSDMERTGYFECSHPQINRLHENVRWGMRGNFLGIPTDCPQRDERLGWTGDIHAFVPTANFLYDTSGLLKGWGKDLVFESLRDGSGVPPHFVPEADIEGRRKVPTAIWGDVVVGLPWELFKTFGDLSILEQHVESMEAWLDKGIPREPASGLWDRNSYQFGDWLDPKAPPDQPGNSVTDAIFVANAFLVYVTSLVQKTAYLLGRTAKAEEYTKAYEKLKKAFQDLYITKEGRVVADTQTAITLCIQFELFPTQKQQETAAQRLSELVRRDYKFKIGTGFAGTFLIGHALTKVGLSQLFYRMLYHRKVPSWLYQVDMGATTMWERWDSLLPDGSVNPGQMTSFNHYALGSVADWMHQTIAGLKPLEPGWRRFQVAPIPGGDLQYAKASFLCAYGWIHVKWVLQDGSFFLEVSVPPSTTAEVVVPGELAGIPQVVGSGVHLFEQRYQAPEWPVLPIYSVMETVHDDDMP